MWDMGNGWGWWMFFGGIWMFGLVALVVWAVSSLTGPGSNRKPDRQQDAASSPLEVLERRYASGEINDEEFERMRRLLRQSPGT